MKQINFIKLKLGSCSLIIVIVFLLITPGCKKWAEVPAPVNSLNISNVYTNDAAAIGVLTGIYAKMSNNNVGQFDELEINGLSNIALTVLQGLSADELTLYSGTEFHTSYYANDLTSTDPNSFWVAIYPVVFVCNAAIEGLEKSSGLTLAVKQQLQGEAKFMRAFCYFYLVNLYGDVPLALSTDYKVNRLLARMSKEQVYHQIIADLKEAVSLLSDDYVDGSLTKTSNERVRPNKWAATALLARAYLYAGDFAKAEAAASEIISNLGMYEILPLNDVFLANSREAIWQLQPVGTDIYANTAEGRLFILPEAGPDDYQHRYYLNSKLMDAFESGDERKALWTGNVTVGTANYNYAYKYKVAHEPVSTTEYMMVLRLGEQYLIRAEARTRQGNISGAVEDLNVLRTRARGSNVGDLPALSATLSPQQALDAVAKERRVELFTEWGHRWLDLKRTGRVDEVMSVETPLKGGNWNSNWQLYPIPLQEIQRDPNLRQNPGYN